MLLFTILSSLYEFGKKSNNCDKTNDVLTVVIEHFHKNCRSDDFLVHIDQNKMLFILINCDAKNTFKVINRIHSVINKRLSKRKFLSISIIYGNMDQRLS